MANFPTLGNKEDSSQYALNVEDVGIRSEMEGGYVLTRPRHTRRPRRTWTTGFTAISELEMETILNFWNQMGTFQAFNYVVRTTQEVVNVRFASPPSFKYNGYGSTFMWNVTDIKLEEV